MKKKSWAGDKEARITACVSICLLALFVIAIFLIIPCSLSPGHDGLFSGGLIRVAISESGDSVRIYGTPVGYSSISREIEGIDAIASKENPATIGFLGVSVTPLVGDLSIDTHRMGIAIARPDNEMSITRSRDSAVSPGHWIIARKYHMIPMKSPDEDDILEAGEIFDLLISLPEPLFPNQKFSIILAPEHGMPWKQELTVPPVIKPVNQFY